MTDTPPEEVEISYIGYKEDGSPFTNEEILELNYSFIAWAENEKLYIGGGINAFPDEDEEEALRG